MKVCALSSGSSGNCFYIEEDKEAILIDAGISSKKIKERLAMLRLSAEKIRGIFITHEHIDHLRGADVFAREFDIPIFATKGTINNGFLCSNNKLINQIKNDEMISLKKLKVETFRKFHSAAEPVSYSIFSKKEDKKVSVITDLGHACKNVAEKIAESDFLFLESNHDVNMLENGPYPYFLKKWIKSDEGHLSNIQAGLSVLEHSNSRLKNIVLSHLSKQNNTPKIALKTFKNLLKERENFNAEISVSLEAEPTRLFKVF